VPAVSTTALTISKVVAFATGNIINVICRGYE
jgi:hypothetical protein